MSNPSPKGFSIVGVVSWMLLLAGFTNLIVGTIAAICQRLDQASLCLVAGLVFLLAATIERFEFLKGFGIEAKTKALDQKIEQADRALEGLRKLGEIAGAALLDINSKMGRWDSAPSPTQSCDLADRVRAMLESLDCDRSVVEKALRPWAESMAVDLCLALTSPIRKAAQEEHRRLNNEMFAIPQPWKADDPNLKRVQKALQDLGEYQERLNKHRFSLADLPEGLFKLIDEAKPFVDGKIYSEALRRAEEFTASITMLRDSNRLANAEKWARTIEEDRSTP